MTYRNPWAKIGEPEDYTTSAPPIEWAGCEIYHVLPKQWDVVKAGTCIAQRAGLGGAKAAAEIVADLLMPTYEDVREREGRA
ncbi:MAG: hypothetical protein WC481_07460 [Candidatus Omnitrophota bacterium]